MVLRGMSEREECPNSNRLRTASDQPPSHQIDCLYPSHKALSARDSSTHRAEWCGGAHGDMICVKGVPQTEGPGEDCCGVHFAGGDTGTMRFCMPDVVVTVMRDWLTYDGSAIGLRRSQFSLTLRTLQNILESVPTQLASP